MTAPTLRRPHSKIWYDTNIPIPEATELRQIYQYWRRRWQSMYMKYSKFPAGTPEFIHYRMIYSRLVELQIALDKL